MESVNTFTGVMDTDSDALVLKNTDFRSALNARNGKGIEFGAMENALGNSLVPYITLPLGTNKCIGTLQDALENTIIYFIWNSNGTHGIYRMYPTEARTELLAGGSQLNFDQNHYIHARLVDRTHLHWTDAFETDTGLVGNEPRQLNIIKANNYQKKLKYEFHFALDDQFTYSTLNTTTLTVTGATVTNIVFSGITDRRSTIAFIRAALTTAGYLVEDMDKSLVISWSTAGQFIALSGSGVATWTRLIKYNWYASGVIPEIFLNWAKPQPIYAPTVQYITDAATPNNRAYEQYCVRYIFDDNSKSAWGSFSTTPWNTNLYGYKTLVDFYDEKLNDTDWLCMIKKVEIGVRLGITQPVRSIIILNTSEIGFVSGSKNILTPSVNSNHYTYNDQYHGIIVGSDDNTSDNNVQVLKLYDSIPQLTHAVNTISDENGSTIATLGNNVFGYDNQIVTGRMLYDFSIFWNPSDPLFPDVLYKTNALYNWGVVYFDKYGRSSAVQKVAPMVTLQKTLIQYMIGWQIDTLPPTWAVSYAIVRTEELIRQRYTSYSCSVITHASSPADETYWKIRNDFVANDLPTSTADITIYFDAKTRADFDLAQKGDKLFSFFDSNGIKVDVPVIGYKILSTGELSFITRNVSTLMAGATETANVIEIYTPRATPDDIYFEVVRLPIIGGYHYGDIQTQTSSLPAKINLRGQDTKYTAYATGTLAEYLGATGLERAYYYDNDKTDNTDIGRPNIIDQNAKKQWFKDEIRFSERYNLHSYYNGLTAFRALDYIEVDYNFGSIQRLENTTKAVLAICQYKVQPIYVNRDRLLDFNSNQSIGRTNRILNIAEAPINNWGTRNPSSVLNIDGRIYAFDAYNGLIWRFAQDGQTIISENKNHNLFKAIGRDRMTITRLTDKVISGYEKEHNTIYFSFSATGAQSAFTISYEDMDETDGFKGYNSFIPEQFAMVNGLFYAFLNGNVWKPDATVARCNYFGVQYPFNVTFASNEAPKATKTPKTIRLQANNYFVCPIMTTYPQVMNSRLAQVAKWRRYEGQYTADVLKDYSDPSKRFADIVSTPLRQTTALLEGRDLHFEAMLVTLQAADPTIKNRLYRADVEFFLSEYTKI